ncbi:FecR family protein [Pedobacter nototheniae]|uniref:FecR family protein n=1 Tax=Pedobacter nototheniae TaxID=2488994 RepID=UPI00292D40AC|nr:FecR domain-containing protein [Pedobacter nototheniae]
MMDDLLMKFLLKESTEEENMDVRAWLNASDENRKYFTQLETIWQLSKTLHNESKVDEELAWTKFKAKTETLNTEQAIVKPLKAKFGWLKIAAVLVIAIGAWTIYNLFGPGYYTMLSTTNKIATEKLPDGSTLTLNKHSKISYAGNFKNNRDLMMDSGDVFFDVAKDKSHPFTITIKEVSVMVVGTSFNIKHLKDETEIIVESGIVKVGFGQAEIKLYKGERILINGKTSKLIKEQSSDELYKYYRTNLFVANNMPLYKLVNTLNEAYGVHIILDDKAKDLSITTVFKMESLDHILNVICQTLNLKKSHQGNDILLSYKE